jgi:hypothetical protein
VDIFKLGDKILALLEMVFGFWNNQVSLVFSMLGQSPVNFKGGGPWQVVESIEPIFVGVGSSLVVLFFVIGFCSESVDVREEMRFEVILRMLIRLGLAIIICNAFINAGLPSFTGNYADWAQTLIYLCEMTFTIALTVGSVKGAQSLTSTALNK